MAKESSEEQLKAAWLLQRRQNAAEFLDLVEKMGPEKAADALGFSFGELELAIRGHQEIIVLPPPPRLAHALDVLVKKRKGE